MFGFSRSSVSLAGVGTSPRPWRATFSRSPYTKVSFQINKEMRLFLIETPGQKHGVKLLDGPIDFLIIFGPWRLIILFKKVSENLKVSEKAVMAPH